MNYDNWKLQNPYNDEHEIIQGICQECGLLTKVYDYEDNLYCYDCYSIIEQLHNNIVIIRKRLLETLWINTMNYNEIYKSNIDESIHILESLIEGYPEFSNDLKFYCLTCKQETILKDRYIVCQNCA